MTGPIQGSWICAEMLIHKMYEIGLITSIRVKCNVPPPKETHAAEDCIEYNEYKAELRFEDPWQISVQSVCSDKPSSPWFAALIRLAT